MTNTVLVTSTAAGTGKTAVAIALGCIARDRGSDVGYMKPKGTTLQTRVGKVLDTDPLLAQEVLDLDEAIETMEPVVYSSTFLKEVIRRSESTEAIRASVTSAYDRIANGRDLVVVDGDAGWSPGRAIRLTDRDIADLLDTKVILVAPYRDIFGIDEILATAEGFGDRFAGVLFNAISEPDRDELESEIIPYLTANDIDVLGVLPRERLLFTVTVADLATEIGAEVVTSCPMDERVSRFSVGAMSSDAALGHFRRSQDTVVVTGGDRSGIQAAALEAPGVRALVLTGGLRPDSPIVSKAEERNVPIMLVTGETLHTIERIEAVIGTGRVRDPDEIAVVRSLLDQHADLSGLIGA